MAEYVVTDTELTALADIIRAKSGSSSSLTFPTGFEEEIQEGIVFQHYYVGSGEPSSSLGVDGDIYLQT